MLNMPKTKIVKIWSQTENVCREKKQYQVALVYNGKNGLSVYVDWEILGSAKPFEMNKENQKELEFYFGHDGAQTNVESHVTVTNVLLYNRPFTTGEIDALKPKREEKTPETQNQIKNKDSDEHTSVENINETADETKIFPKTLINQTDINNKTINNQSLLSLKDSAVRVGVNVFSLLFGVFTLLGRYVY